MPLFHVTGEVPVMLNSFVIGRCMVMMPKWDAGEALRLIEKEKITYFVGVPTMSLELMNHPDRHEYDLSSLNDITAGGAPRPVSHVERLKQEFPNAQPALGYGLTETNAVGCINFWGSYAAKPASTGRAAKPLVEVAILGDERQPSAARRDSAKSASARRPTSSAIGATPKRPQALFTADGIMSAPATSAISTRTAICSSSTARKRSSSAAARISPPPRSRPNAMPVRQSPKSAVFGVPDERLGEVPIAIVHSKDGERLREGDLRAFLDGKLAKFKIPERIIFSDRAAARASAPARSTAAR